MLSEYLRNSDFRASTASDGLAAINRIEGEQFDLIILDVMLPSLNGFDVLRHLRKTNTMPVIMLTARDEDVDCILGLELGADDYLSKPFNPRQLVARVRAVLRRSDRAKDLTKNVLLAGPLSVSPATMTAKIGGVPLSLTGTEFRMLEALIEVTGGIRSREYLAERVLGRAFSTLDRSIDTHVSNLRRKILACGSQHIEIRSIRGSGYMLIDGSGLSP